MKCTREYFNLLIGSRLDPQHMLVGDCRVVQRTPHSVRYQKTLLRGVRQVASRQTLFQYSYWAAAGRVRVWVHEGFTESQAKELFDGFLLEIIHDLSPPDYVTNERSGT